MTPEERKARALRALQRAEAERNAPAPAGIPPVEEAPAEDAIPEGASVVRCYGLRAKLKRRGQKGTGLIAGERCEGFMELDLSNGSDVTGTLRLNFINHPDLLRLSRKPEFIISIITPKA